MNQQEEKVFFDSAVNALMEEDKHLKGLFQSNAPLYADEHNGISCLYETTIVYQVFKKLLQNQFPLKVSWEHPYEGNPAKKADMALVRDGVVDSLVEFKLWLSDDCEAIRKDVLKLEQHGYTTDKYICIVEYSGGDLADNTEFLLKENPEMELVSTAFFDTLFHDRRHGHIDKSVFMYLFKLKSHY